MRAGEIVQLDERQRSVGGVGTTLGWLIWLLSGIGVVIVVAYVLRERVDAVRASLDLLARGRVADFAAYFISVSVWVIAQLGQALVQNWPWVVIVAALALLVWALRNL